MTLWSGQRHRYPTPLLRFHQIWKTRCPLSGIRTFFIQGLPTRWPLSARITCDDHPPLTPHPQLPNIYCNTIFSDLSASLVISGLRMFQALLQELNAEPCHSFAAAVFLLCTHSLSALTCWPSFSCTSLSRKEKKNETGQSRLHL